MTGGFLHLSLNDCKGFSVYRVKMNVKDESGNRIKAARSRSGLTLEEVCAQVPGLKPARLSNWEHGRNMLSVEEAKRLAPVLKVTAAYLLTLEDSLPDPKEQVLLRCYRKTDERGKNQIIRTAELESDYISPSRPNADANAA